MQASNNARWGQQCSSGGRKTDNWSYEGVSLPFPSTVSNLCVRIKWEQPPFFAAAQTGADRTSSPPAQRSMSAATSCGLWKRSSRTLCWERPAGAQPAVRWRFVEKRFLYHNNTHQFATEFTSVSLKAAVPECRSKTKRGVHLGVRVQDCSCLLPSLQSTEKGALNNASSTTSKSQRETEMLFLSSFHPQLEGQEARGC